MIPDKTYNVALGNQVALIPTQNNDVINIISITEALVQLMFKHGINGQ